MRPDVTGGAVKRVCNFKRSRPVIRIDTATGRRVVTPPRYFNGDLSLIGRAPAEVEVLEGRGSNPSGRPNCRSPQMVNIPMNFAVAPLTPDRWKSHTRCLGRTDARRGDQNYDGHYFPVTEVEKGTFGRVQLSRKWVAEILVTERYVHGIAGSIPAGEAKSGNCTSGRIKSCCCGGSKQIGIALVNAGIVGSTPIFRPNK